MEKHAGDLRRELIKELGMSSFKFLVTLNGGAFIVMLTFVGNVQQNAQFKIDLLALKVAMSMFLLGLFFTFCGIAIAYTSAQLSLEDRTLPGAGTARGHIVWLTLPVVLAFFAFVFGVAAAMLGISE
ncbi:MAG: hypothetical protein AAFQ64_15445 [Pseudomonadota bacterium]